MNARPSAAAPRTQLRVWTLHLLLLSWAGVVVARLFWLQVVDYGWLTKYAQRQQTQTVTLTPERGAIYDRNLQTLAMSLGVDSVFAAPQQVSDPAQVADGVAPVLGDTAAAIEAKLATEKNFVWLERQVTAAQSAAIRRLDLKGVGLEPDQKRFYPTAALAANVLGYVGRDGEGLAGVEEALDRDMRGHAGAARVEVDARRQRYDQLEQQPQAGDSVALTLDKNIQFIAQTELDRQVASTRAQRGIAIVENPHTGEILALAVSPTFDADDYAAVAPERRNDPAVSEVYEPGSVFKLVTLSAALQEGLVTPNDIIDCQMGSIRVGGRLIHDHAPFGKITVTEVLQHSSDVGAIKIGMRLGDARLYQYLRAYGFGEATGVRLPGESRGLARPVREWQPMSIGAVSIGQEIAATPLQVISLVATLADGGVYHAPRIVLEEFAGSPPATPPPFIPAPGRRVVSAVVANEMKQMMAQVVLAGTARQAQLNGYTAAGKTGTAQKVDPGTHGYSTRNFISSFGGFAPINDPAVAILVVVDSPQGGHEGGPTAGPVFKNIAERVLPYLGVPHDIPALTPPTLKARARPAVPAGADATEESEILSDPAAAAGARVDASGAQPAAIAAPMKAAAAMAAATVTVAAPSTAPVAANEVVLDYALGGTERMMTPNFTGQTVRSVADLCQRLGLKPALEGSGVARAQSPAAGTPLQRGTPVVVRFTP